MLLDALTVLTFLAISAIVFGMGVRTFRNANSNQHSRPVSHLAETMAAAMPIRQSKFAQVRKELIQAGVYRTKAIHEFLAIRNVCLMSWILLVAVTLFLLADVDASMLRRVAIIGVVVATLILGLPPVMLSGRAKLRRNRIQHSLPDALDMLTMMVSGGLSLPKSILRVSNEVRLPHPDLATELGIVAKQTEMGSLQQAMKQFADRMDLPDIRGLSAMVQHTERLGTPVATALADYADSVRKTRRQLAEERGNKRSVVLLFPVIGLLAPPIYILLLGPAVLELRDFVNRENRPGGVLAPSVPAESQQLQQRITRESAPLRR